MIQDRRTGANSDRDRGSGSRFKILKAIPKDVTWERYHGGGIVGGLMEEASSRRRLRVKLICI